MIRITRHLNKIYWTDEILEVRDIQNRRELNFELSENSDIRILRCWNIDIQEYWDIEILRY